MVKYCVATDSGCDLPDKLCKEKDIYAYAMKYSIEDEEYNDQMTPEFDMEFYNKMRAGVQPHTSQMTPIEFIELWSLAWKEKHLPIVHIALGSAISGTYANGLLAKEIFERENPEAEIYLVDSTLASLGYGMLCIWAAEMRDSGKSPQECTTYLEENKLSINTYYTTDDLIYLYRSGRVSRAGVIVASALNINPILDLDREGHLIVREKARGRKRAIKRIYEIIGERVIDPQKQIVYICHADCNHEEVKSFAAGLIERFKFRDALINYIGPTIGAHSGPDLIAAFFIGKQRYM